MYNELNEIVQTYRKGYHKRAIKNRVIDEYSVGVLSAYTKMWATEEIEQARVSDNLKFSDMKLYREFEAANSYGVEIGSTPYLLELTEKLVSIDNALNREEAENLGIGPEAHRLRKEWCRTRREIHKFIKGAIKYKINWIKEKSKPRQEYVINATGEIHDGLYWTLRELILHPSYIKYGFRKETSAE